MEFSVRFEVSPLNSNHFHLACISVLGTWYGVCRAKLSDKGRMTRQESLGHLCRYRESVNSLIHGKRESSDRTDRAHCTLSKDTAALGSLHRLWNFLMYNGRQWVEIHNCFDSWLYPQVELRALLIKINSASFFGIVTFSMSLTMWYIDLKSPAESNVMWQRMLGS